MAEPLTLYLAAPRGFCAGVDRAIKIVEMALEKWGAPVYVRHEIVHNRFVVDGLKAKGAVFVEELESARPTARWSSPPTASRSRCPPRPRTGSMLYLDATCPLVSKVHLEAARHHENGLQMVMIGHAGHPEVIGTMGQLPDGAVLLVETPEDVAKITPADPPASPTSPRPPSPSTTPPRSSPRCAPASRRSSVPTRKTSATPPPTARRRSRRWRR